jgi:hypothetical protein
MIKLFSSDRRDAGRAVVWIFKPKHLTYSRFNITRATKNGGPVLRGDKSLRKVNGFVVSIRGAVVFVTFRRFWSL